MATKEHGTDQHFGLHETYGKENCCLCRAEAERDALKAEVERKAVEICDLKRQVKQLLDEKVAQKWRPGEGIDLNCMTAQMRKERGIPDSRPGEGKASGPVLTAKEVVEELEVRSEVRQDQGGPIGVLPRGIAERIIQTYGDARARDERRCFALKAEVERLRVSAERADKMKWLESERRDLIGQVARLQDSLGKRLAEVERLNAECERKAIEIADLKARLLKECTTQEGYWRAKEAGE